MFNKYFYKLKYLQNELEIYKSIAKQCNKEKDRLNEALNKAKDKIIHLREEVYIFNKSCKDKDESSELKQTYFDIQYKKVCDQLKAQEIKAQNACIAEISTEDLIKEICKRSK